MPTHLAHLHATPRYASHEPTVSCCLRKAAVCTRRVYANAPFCLTSHPRIPVPERRVLERRYRHLRRSWRWTHRWRTSAGHGGRPPLPRGQVRPDPAQDGARVRERSGRRVGLDDRPLKRSSALLKMNIKCSRTTRTNQATRLERMKDGNGIMTPATHTPAQCSSVPSHSSCLAPLPSVTDPSVQSTPNFKGTLAPHFALGGQSRALSPAFTDGSFLPSLDLPA